MKLSIVIPCYNERDTIESLLQAVKDSPVKDKEIVIVDDGSTDGTRDFLGALNDPCIRIVLHKRNQGKGAALRTGFQNITGEICIVQDADLEYDPQEYPLVIGPIVEGKADVVYGSRFQGGRPHRVVYFWHRLGNAMLTTLSNMCTDLNLTDMETCYKAFRREVIQSIQIHENRFGFEPEITAKIAKNKHWRVYEVGISYYGRTYEQGKKIGWKDGLRAIYCILKYNLLA
jgi:glycosyltransferase involved in cell wall biosynthesis